MMIFKFFHVKKMLNEARKNPSAFAGSEVHGTLWAIFLIPLVIIIGAIVLFFILGYTDLFGFHHGIFKFLFWLTLAVSTMLFLILRRIIRAISRVTARQTKNILHALGDKNK
ncbi:MAG: hypothetical protein V4665_00305 [Patescibacteria group bacterium]